MNRVIFLGRLTRDPESRTSATGTEVSTFTLAVNRQYSKEKEADFFNIIAFNKTAEFCNKYFRKGLQVVIEGRVQNKTWEDQSGQKRYGTDFIAEHVYFADSKNNQTTESDFITIEDDGELPF